MDIALKEWAVVTAAMQQGFQHLLVRKGGLADKDQTFKMDYRKFLLFPTYEHQKNEMIAAQYQDLYQQVLAARPSTDALIIESWAEVQDVFVINHFDAVRQLAAFHIWSEAYLKMRANYKPERALVLVVLRIFNLLQPRKLKNLARYGGCRSWVKLSEEISLEASLPAISDDHFRKVHKTIQDKIQLFANSSRKVTH